MDQSEKTDSKIFYSLMIVQIAVLALGITLGLCFGTGWAGKLGDPLRWAAGAACGGITAQLSTWLTLYGLRKNYEPAVLYVRFAKDVSGGMNLSRCAAASLASGLCEEILFRGVLLPITGLWISSLLFGAVHWSGRKMWPWPALTCLIGFGLGFYSLKSGDLSGCTGFHMANNLTAFLIIKKLMQKGTI